MPLLNCVCVSGLLMGEIMSAVLSREGIDMLTNLPKGNAEAELMSIVPVFYVYHYLETGDHWNTFFQNPVIEKQYLKRKLKEGKLSISHIVHKNLVFFKPIV